MFSNGAAATKCTPYLSCLELILTFWQLPEARRHRNASCLLLISRVAHCRTPARVAEGRCTRIGAFRSRAWFSKELSRLHSHDFKQVSTWFVFSLIIDCKCWWFQHEVGWSFTLILVLGHSPLLLQRSTLPKPFVWVWLCQSFLHNCYMQGSHSVDPVTEVNDSRLWVVNEF